MKPDQRFRPRERLCRQRDFEQVFLARCSAKSEGFVVYIAPNKLGWTRLGIRMSARFGTAVERNRARRRIREMFRTNKDRWPIGFDVICLPTRKVLDPGYSLTENLATLLTRAVSRWNRANDRRS
jgi:ribonuclease P protein component